MKHNKEIRKMTAGFSFYLYSLVSSMRLAKKFKLFIGFPNIKLIRTIAMSALF
jgi:hypothetical protein